MQSGCDNLLIVRTDLGFAKRRCGNLLHEGCTCSGAVEEQLVQDKNDVFGERDIGVIAVVHRLRCDKTMRITNAMIGIIIIAIISSSGSNKMKIV